MRKSELIFNAILVPLDYLMIVLGGLAAYWLRFTTLGEELPIIYQIPFRNYFLVVLTIALIWLGIFALAGLFKIKIHQRLTDELGRVFLACSAGIMFIIFIIFIRREFFSSRFIILASWLLAIIFVSLSRIFLREFRKFCFRRGIGRRKALIVGKSPLTENIIKALSEYPASGYEIVDWIKDPAQIDSFRLKKFTNSGVVDELIQTDPGLAKEKTMTLVDFCDENHITFRYAADLFDALATNVEVATIAGIPIVEIKRTSLDGWGRIVKRIFDIIVSTIGLVIFSSLFAILAILIKLDSKGPVLVSLARIGEKGKPFKLYNFRSMVKNAHQMKGKLVRYNERNDGPLFKMANDPRITKIGKWLRRTSLDELPQLINVFRGQMSLVGPRPHEPGEVARYQKHHKKLLTIKPGITGMAQISGRSDLTFEEEVKLDSYYIENWSLGIDFQILFKTPQIVLSRKSAC